MCFNTLSGDTQNPIGGSARRAAAAVTLTLASLLTVAPVVTADENRPAVAANENRRAAGQWQGSEWVVNLRAGRGRWQPEGPDGRRELVEAFGEAGGPLTVPAPLVRIRAGTTLTIRVANELDSPLRVNGLCARDAAGCPVLEVPAAGLGEVRFKAGQPGTYHYWATSTAMPLSFRGGPDSLLSGGFIVDPSDGPVAPDRVFVITEWSGLSREQLAHVVAQPDPGATFLQLRPPVVFAINGRAWPHTERLSYDAGESVRWRVINLSTQPHPMHLHGFYFDVTRQGDGLRDQPIGEHTATRVVTHLMAPGTTADLAWTPERTGQWLFHCHTMLHVSSTLNVDGSPKTMGGHAEHDHDAAMGMTGPVMGIVVRDRTEKAWRDSSASPGAARQLTLVMRTDPHRFGPAPALGFVLAEGKEIPAPGPVPVPGPTLILQRGKPVEIALVNELGEPTAIHWHGMELESYYDGVHGWSGAPGRIAPIVKPGETFTVRFTPPRAGTFIYHTHLHDNRQLTSGLYGALLVVDQDQPLDESTDHVFVVGRGGPALDAPVVVNGSREPQALWLAGRRHRLRMINITPNDTMVATLRTASEVVQWRLAAKDGATVDPMTSARVPASQIIGVGETYDFELEIPKGRQTLWLELKSPDGRWYAQGQIIVH